MTRREYKSMNIYLSWLVRVTVTCKIYQRNQHHNTSITTTFATDYTILSVMLRISNQKLRIYSSRMITKILQLAIAVNLSPETNNPSKYHVKDRTMVKKTRFIVTTYLIRQHLLYMDHQKYYIQKYAGYFVCVCSIHTNNKKL